jgi:cobalamin biosynthesis Mg chelatase CobN
MLPPSDRRLPRRLMLALALTSLASAGSPQLLSAAAATPAGASTSSTASKTTSQALPVPASAKAQNGLDATSTVAPSNAGGASAPATTSAVTPTTTYVPSGATGQPAAPSTATSPTASVPAVTSATAMITRTPAKTTAKGDRPLSTGAVMIAVLAGLLILACLAWALARRRAFEPHWLLSLRHAMAEAGFRASATWAEFTDWARLGR